MTYEKEKEYLESIIETSSEDEQKELYNWVLTLGYNKCLEMRDNYLKILPTEGKIPFYCLYAFSLYEYTLSSLLYSLLRMQEDMVKAYLANISINTKLSIESRPSNFSKTKYYFLFPNLGEKDKYIHIRTSAFTKGPVPYYDAIRTLDFGDVNLLFSHLPASLIFQFSNNENIIADLDRTRKLRNYVYHHNLLYSLGKENLIKSIILLIKNLPSDYARNFFINEINQIPTYPRIDEKYLPVIETLAVHLGEEERKEIFAIKANII